MPFSKHLQQWLCPVGLPVILSFDLHVKSFGSDIRRCEILVIMLGGQFSISFGTNSVAISQSFSTSFGTASVVIFALVRNYHRTRSKVISGSGRNPHNLRKTT